MADEARPLRPAAVARKWLEDPRVGYSGDLSPDASESERQTLSSMVMPGARVSLAEPGRVVCSLRVRAPLTDADGRWHAGAIAAAVDNVCSAVVFTVVGEPTVTVHYSLSYFSPAHPNEEVEMEGRVVSRKGKLTAAAVEVRKKESRELVAIGRQWATPASPTKNNKSSKL
ncbi:hypothetical protein HU200_037278 [Digitaria exilis]|uniref:Thioesterase domain-containing protein n=1 Tax=Digitaria exilis TaxID=1010633 RepID=A0A835ELV9_9POAL|nr:hypothetical protein HU200_037278 [Digitaria exilis]CAB3478248.1 unnamed protein product [Digitaria exilis]